MAIIGGPGGSRGNGTPVVRRRRFRKTSEPCRWRGAAPVAQHHFKTCGGKQQSVDLYECHLLDLEVMTHNYCNGPKSCSTCEHYKYDQANNS